MESTFEQGGKEVTRSLKQSWAHCKQVCSASSAADAWQSAKLAVDALPMWALVLLPVLAALLVIDRSLLMISLAVFVFLFATYATVKRAVADALKERESG